MCIWGFFVWHELRTFRAEQIRFYEHMTKYSFWNYIDVMSLLLVLATYIIRAVECTTTRFKASPVTYALGLPLLYINILKYMQGFEESGKLVSMIVGICNGVRVFTLILAVVMTGFAFAFHVLFKAGSGIVDGVCGEDQVYTQSNVGMALLGIFALLLGDFDLEDYTATFDVRASIVLFYIFMFLVQIIFLNLLIAIMGDIYDEIQENAKAQFLFSKASIILEFESIMPAEETGDAQKFPPFLQVLTSEVAVGVDDGWSGKMKSLKQAITLRSEETQQMVKHEMTKRGQEAHSGTMKCHHETQRMVKSELEKAASTQSVAMKDEMGKMVEEIATLKAAVHEMMELLKRTSEGVVKESAAAQ
jgi:hypothetical protein